MRRAGGRKTITIATLSATPMPQPSSSLNRPQLMSPQHLVHPALHDGVVGSQLVLAFLPVAELACDHSPGKVVNVHASTARRSTAAKNLIHPRLHRVVLVARAARRASPLPNTPLITSLASLSMSPTTTGSDPPVSSRSIHSNLPSQGYE